MFNAPTMIGARDAVHVTTALLTKPGPSEIRLLISVLCWSSFHVVDNHHFDGAPRRCHLEPQLIFNRTHTRRSEHRAKFLMTGSRSQRIMKCRESFRYARSEPFVSYFEGVYSIVRIVDVLRATLPLPLSILASAVFMEVWPTIRSKLGAGTSKR